MSENKRKKVLILDDEQEIINLIKSFFSRKNLFDVITYTNPLLALEYISNNNIDLVLSDIMMPEMNGIEVLKKLKNQNQNIKVIMMTAFSTFDKIQECEELGADDYVTKPFSNIKDLENRILENLGL